MNILQIMGCTSDQYASLEHYLVKKTRYCNQAGFIFIVAYNNEPKDKKFIADLLKEGATLIKLEARSLLDIHFYLEFYKIIRIYNINVVHAYFAPTRHYAIMAAWYFGVKRRFRQAANLPLARQSRKGIKYNIFLFRHRFLSLFATKYICRSNAVKNEYLKMGIKPHKLSVADGGTDTEKYKKLKGVSAKGILGFTIKPDTYIIGTASRLVKEKGIDVLLKAIKILIEKKVNIYCIILGDGPEKKNLQNLSNNIGVTNHINFSGHNENLENYYSIMDLYVSTSFAEGMSNSVLEAMSCELPVVLSDIEPNKEIIETAQKLGLYIGELFIKGDENDLSDKILKIINKKSIDDIKRNARKLILQRYSVEGRIIKELDIYMQN